MVVVVWDSRLPENDSNVLCVWGWELVGVSVFLACFVLGVGDWACALARRCGMLSILLFCCLCWLGSNMRSPCRPLPLTGEVGGGLHGHNRLAGCSLMDCVVFGRIAGERAAHARPAACPPMAKDVFAPIR